MKFQFKIKKLMLLWVVCVLVPQLGWGQEENVTVLKEVVVKAKKEKGKVLSDVEGTKIYSGKKTSLINLEEPPTIINNNYRQALQKTAGLLLSEETTPLFSVGYRGLAPHRAQFTQVLKDGIPIHADMFGYPEAYYTPPLNVVDHIDFIRGGGALMYGPQPGGALNFVTKDPYEDGPVSLNSENSIGSHDLFSHYTSLSGTKGSLGYYSYLHHRQSQGFRANNSQYDVFYGGSKFNFKKDDGSVWKLGLDGYKEEHGEPGGLTRADFDSDLTKTTRLNDHFELNRYAGSLIYEREIDPQSFVELKIFGGYYERLSWRQRTSGSSFGTTPNGTTNDIEDQEFLTGGTEARIRQNYAGFGADDNTLTMGMLYYHVTSPRLDKRGSTADAKNGSIRKDTDRYMNYVSLFAENLFKFGKLSVTPGIRLENIWQSVKENINLDKTTVSLSDVSEFDFVPLGGLGVAYDILENTQLYTNISQSYRPKIFTQAVPTGSGQVANEDLKEGKAWQTDIGIRGSLAEHFYWDASLFYMEFEDQIGTSGSTVENVGDARHRGIEVSLEWKALDWFDQHYSTHYAEKLGSINLFTNAMVLDAKFTQGPNDGKTPQYAPDFIFKTGVEYNYKDRTKLRLAGTFVDDHFANDTNTATFAVPSYKVWDLTADVKVYKDAVSLFAGINNLFDEKYFARVRSDGIDPADGRNYYAGLKFIW